MFWALVINRLAGFVDLAVAIGATAVLVLRPAATMIERLYNLEQFSSIAKWLCWHLA
jgi:hypothetical protein